MPHFTPFKKILYYRQVPKTFLPFEAALLLAEHESSPDGILVVDAVGKIISYNRRFVRMWGIPRAIIRSRSDKRAIQSVLNKLVDPRGFVKRVQYLYRHPMKKSKENLILKDGRVFERHSSPILGKGKNYGRVWNFRDITTLREAESLRHKEKLRREFVAHVSHELRTPLAAIKGFAETLAHGGLSDVKNRLRFVRTIERHADRLAKLVEELLEVSSPEPRKQIAAPPRKT